MNGLIVGVGAPDRGDDAVGSAVVEELRRRGLPGVTAVVATSPSRLLDLWADRSPVVIVDAVRTGRRPPGTVSVSHVDDLPLTGGARAGGTHGFGVADALELARALDRLPDRVVLVTVEAVGFDQGSSLSPAVVTSVPVAADAAVCAARGDGA